jgi:hydroxymethylglutaryl-CoA lyase
VYEGRISEDAVIRSAERLVRTGVKEISLADTTGMATPPMIQRTVQRVRSEFNGIQISLHLHDTRGLGLANAYSGYEAGVRSFDVCTGGLGGCPFVKGAAGNLPTEDAVNMFESMGVSTGIDLKAICQIVEFLEKLFGRRLPGKMKQVVDQGPGIRERK